MAYDREVLKNILKSIPKGRVTRHGLIGESMGTIGRAVAPFICNHKNDTERFRVVLKYGKFPHPKDKKDCSKRAKQLRSEGLEISKDNLRVIIKIEDMWKP